MFLFLVVAFIVSVRKSFGAVILDCKNHKTCREANRFCKEKFGTGLAPIRDAELNRSLSKSVECADSFVWIGNAIPSPSDSIESSKCPQMSATHGLRQESCENERGFACQQPEPRTALASSRTGRKLLTVFSCVGDNACIDQTHFLDPSVTAIECNGESACRRTTFVYASGTSDVALNCVGNGENTCRRTKLVATTTGSITTTCTSKFGCYEAIYILEAYGSITMTCNTPGDWLVCSGIDVNATLKGTGAFTMNAASLHALDANGESESTFNLVGENQNDVTFNCEGEDYTCDSLRLNVDIVGSSQIAMNCGTQRSCRLSELNFQSAPDSTVVMTCNGLNACQIVTIYCSSASQCECLLDGGASQLCYDAMGTSPNAPTVILAPSTSPTEGPTSIPTFGPTLAPTSSPAEPQYNVYINVNLGTNNPVILTFYRSGDGKAFACQVIPSSDNSGYSCTATSTGTTDPSLSNNNYLVVEYVNPASGTWNDRLQVRQARVRDSQGNNQGAHCNRNFQCYPGTNCWACSSYDSYPWQNCARSMLTASVTRMQIELSTDTDGQCDVYGFNDNVVAQVQRDRASRVFAVEQTSSGGDGFLPSSMLIAVAAVIGMVVLVAMGLAMRWYFGSCTGIFDGKKMFSDLGEGERTPLIGEGVVGETLSV